MQGISVKKKPIMEATSIHEKSDKDDLIATISSNSSDLQPKVVESKPKPKIDKNAENLTWLENGSVEFNRPFTTTRRAGMQYRHHNFLVPFSVDKQIKKLLIEDDICMNELVNLLFIELIEKGQLPTKLIKQYKKETGKS